MSMHPVIRSEGLSKRFAGTTALDDVSFEVRHGQLICVMGPNGSGKSTLLKILAGLLLPSAGTAYIEGRDVRRMDGALRRMIGYAAGERPGFYDQLTARQNLLFFAALWGLRGASATRRVDALLDDFGIEPNQPYQTYSTGTKQRLLLARSLLHEPAVLLWDEPTRSLDAQWRVQCFEKLLAWAHGPLQKTIIVATHRPEEAQQADCVISLRNGKSGSVTDFPDPYLPKLVPVPDYS